MGAHAPITALRAGGKNAPAGFAAFFFAFLFLPSRRLLPLVRLVAAGDKPVQPAATAGIDSRFPPVVVHTRMRRAFR
jgi:hypothetical protein